MSDYKNAIAILSRTKRIYYPDIKVMYAGTFEVIIGETQIIMRSIVSEFTLFAQYPEGVTAEDTLKCLLGL